MSIFKRRHEPGDDGQNISPEQAEKFLKQIYSPLGGDAAALIVAREVSVEECGWLKDTVEAGTVVYRFTLSTYGCCNLKEGVPVSIQPDEYPFFELPRDALAGEI